MFWKKKKPAVAKVSAPIARFLAELRQVAPPADRGSYRFRRTDGHSAGFVQFVPQGDSLLEIHRLWSPDPGRGDGSKILRTLCELADRHGVDIRLKVTPIGRKPYPLTREQLKAWYGRYGFEGEKWKLVRHARAELGKSA